MTDSDPSPTPRGPVTLQTIAMPADTNANGEVDEDDLAGEELNGAPDDVDDVGLTVR